MNRLACILGVCLGLVGDEHGALESIGRLAHEPIREASGIVASRKHAGIFWVLNDSGNQPAIFAVRRDGTLVREFRVAAPNVDWEAIAIDDDGFLYLGDIGNNFGRLPVRAVYKIAEPDPTRSAPVKPLPVVAAVHYRFDAAGRFDAEALFVDSHKHVFIVSKTADHREAELFRIEFNPAATLFRPAVPTRVGVIPGFIEQVTGADITPDGLRLAVCSYGVLRVYEQSRGAASGWRRVGELKFTSDGVEGICWDGDDLILCSESRHLYRVRPAKWSLKPE